MIYLVLDDLNGFLTETGLSLENHLPTMKAPIFEDTYLCVDLSKKKHPFICTKDNAALEDCHADWLFFSFPLLGCYPNWAISFAEAIVDAHKNGSNIIVNETRLDFFWELNRLQKENNFSENEIKFWDRFVGFVRRGSDGYYCLPSPKKGIFIHEDS